MRNLEHLEQMITRMLLEALITTSQTVAQKKLHR